MRKPIVHSPRRQSFFAESSELCFQTKTSLKISQFTLFLFIQSFSHPIGDKKVRKYIHTYAFTRLSHANFLIKLVCDSKHTFSAHKNDDGQISLVLVLRTLLWSFLQKTYKLSKRSQEVYTCANVKSRKLHLNNFEKSKV